LLEEKAKNGLPIEVETPSGAVTIDAGDFSVSYRAADGWVGIADRGTQVALDTRITDELAAEGMARDVVRHVNDTRKKAGLQMEDRIELHLHTDSAKLSQAIARHRDYIMAETLVSRWSDTPLQGGGVFSSQVSVDGQALQIGLRKAPR
jgi:isoleucyl-tRNA synthetase